MADPTPEEIAAECYKRCREYTSRGRTGYCHALCQLAGMFCPVECPDAIATYGKAVAAALSETRQ